MKSLYLKVRHINDITSWLFKSSKALYPSIYLFKNNYNQKTRKMFIKARIDEALRVKEGLNLGVPIYPYFWFRFVYLFYKCFILFKKV